MSSSSSNAVQNNNRLFPPFARKLAQNDPTVYATFADKLALWLGSERAYYPAARLEIVKLLLTAHTTLRRAVGADASSNVPFHISTCIGHPMTAPYARLLKAVHPHRELFVEPDLRGQIRQLLSTVSMPSAISADDLDETALRNGFLSPVNGHTPPMQFSSSSLASALQMPFPASDVPSPASLPQPLSQTAPAMTLNTVASEGSILSSDFSHPPDSSIPTHPSQPTQSVASTGQSTSITKKRKKAKFELASLVAKDLEELNRKRAVKQEPMEEADYLLKMPHTNGAPVSTSSSYREDSVDSSLLRLVDTKTSGVGSMHASAKNTADSSFAMEIETEHADTPLLEAGHSGITPDQPRYRIHHSMEMTNLVSGPTSVSAGGPDIPCGIEYLRTQRHWEEPSGSFGSTTPNAVDMVDDTGLVPEAQTDHRAILANSTLGEKNAHDVAYEASDVDYNMLEDISANRRSAGVDTGDELPVQDPVSDAVGQPTEDVEPECLTGLGSEALVPSPLYAPNTLGVPSEVTNTLGSHIVTGHGPKASSVGQSGRPMDEGTVQADVPSSAPIFCEHEPQVPTATDSSPSTDEISHLSLDVDNSLEAAHAVPTATLVPMQDTTTSSSSTSPKRNMQIGTALHALREPSFSPSPTISLTPNNVPNVFGDKMRILAICRGLSNNNKITLRFDIPEEELQALGIWNNRRNGKEGLQESLCISLACYAWKKGGQKTVDELSALPACWPKIGGLTMDVLYQGRREEFPLSPPFMVAPNGLVDVSEFLSPGSNVIELNHRLDMSGYIFILRVHSPTSGQLEEVAQRHRKKQEWQEWLRHVSRPLDIPLPSFS